MRGVDHLLFVLALMLLVTGFWRLLKTITAFTVAHSVTLALATLGFVNVPSAPTEALIALSIVFVAVEIIRKRRGEAGFAERNPWSIAFLFGLFHGLGFAGALSEIGVPTHEVPLALLMFNVGVELGQVMFVCVVLAVLVGIRQVKLPAIRRPSLQFAFATAPVYAIGSVAAFWTIEDRKLGSETWTHTLRPRPAGRDRGQALCSPTLAGSSARCCVSAAALRKRRGIAGLSTVALAAPGVPVQVSPCGAGGTWSACPSVS